MNDLIDKTAPKAIMLLGTSCPHCPSVLKHLSQLIKVGDISQLTVINLEQYPEKAREYGVRSVPWVKIGSYELTGAQNLAALQQRVAWANKDSSLAGEFDYWLSEAQVDKAIDFLKKDPKAISAILELLGDSATVLSTRIGIGVIMEEFSGSDLIQQLIPDFAKLADHEDARVRADTLHYLGLTESQDAVPILQQHVDDKDAEVRGVVTDSLEALFPQAS